MTDDDLCVAAAAFATETHAWFTAAVARTAPTFAEEKTLLDGIANEKERRARTGVRVRANPESLDARQLQAAKDMIKALADELVSQTVQIKELSVRACRAVALMAQMSDALGAPERVEAARLDAEEAARVQTEEAAAPVPNRLDTILARLRSEGRIERAA